LSAVLFFYLIVCRRAACVRSRADKNHGFLEVRADAICSAAARRPLFIGGGGAPFNFCRRRRKIFSGAPAAARRPETPDPISHFLFSIFLQFYQYKSAFYLLFNRQA
jgi:hypothetical protein